MAGVAVTSLVEKLRRLRMNHAHLISGIVKELDLLQMDLSVLKEFLLVHDDDDDEGEDEACRALREAKREIKECVYEVEDSIDTYLTEMAAPNKHKNFLAGFPFRRRINSGSERKMEPLLMKIAKVKEVTTRKILPAGHMSSTFRDRGYGARAITTLLPVQMDNVVGRDDEENTIINLLMKPGLGVISIVGVGGLGKSTLARKIYVNTSIAYEFPVRIWIHISYDFNLDDILGNILRVFTSQDIHSLSHEELSENVEACLEKKKFLLVLDNMWSIYDWEAIKDVLPKSNNKGKVLITTRDRKVGGRRNFYINLRFLNAEDSWKLLRLKLFGNLEGWSPELEAVWRSIVRKCYGLPLNIILVGGILKRILMKSRIPDPIEDVLKLYENVNLDSDEFMVNEFMELAYRRLPEELRQCFLYMGVFPEHYEISAWTLTRLWISEGFVRPMEGHSLEEAATQNLDDLIRMSLVMVDKINPFGKVKTCRVHDIISSFIIKKAAEQGLFHLLSLDHFLYRHSRRLCVHSKANTNSVLTMVPNISGIRSVLCFNESSTGLDPDGMSTILKTSNLLKVLDSQSIKFEKLPQEITKLFHLRYVTLFVDDLNTLPEPLSELWNLETLVVDTKSRAITMEANIWRLIWLRHLKTNAAIVLSSNNEDQSLAGGANLQTLTRLSPESCTRDVSKRAPNLKSLGIRGDLEILFRKMFLKRFNLLEKLKLIHDVFPNISSKNRLHQLSLPNCFPPGLKWLTLSQTHLLWDRDMPTLANIKTLQVLKLKDDAFSGIIWRASGDCFPNLKFFLIENTDLVIWKASTESLPTLSCLVLKNCENLTEIPEAVAGKLERLEIEHLGKSAVDSARRIADQKQQIADQKQQIADQKQQAQEKEESNCSFKLYIGPGCY